MSPSSRNFLESEFLSFQPIGAAATHMIMATSCRSVRANGAKLYVLGMWHSSHMLWSVDHVSFCARFLEMRQILNSRFLPNLWRGSDASVLGEAGGWGWALEVVQLC